jgi:hypothetical protein
MSAFERFWTSYFGRLAVRGIARLFPTWFHERTWKCGEQDAIIRRELSERAQACANAATLDEVIRRVHELLLTLLNEGYGGLALEQYIPSPSVRTFSQLYTIIMAMFCFRLSSRVDGLREDLLAICRERHLVESAWGILEESGKDEPAQARRIWDECLRVLGGDSTSQSSFFRGFFVLVANRAADELREAAA